MRIDEPKLSIDPLNVPVITGFVPASPAGVVMANRPVYPLVPLTTPPMNASEFADPSAHVHTALRATSPAWLDDRDTAAIRTEPDDTFDVYAAETFPLPAVAEFDWSRLHATAHHPQALRISAQSGSPWLLFPDDVYDDPAEVGVRVPFTGSAQYAEYPAAICDSSMPIVVGWDR